MIKKEQLDILFESIKYGLNVTDSCRKANISHDTYYKRYKRDKEFVAKVEKSLIEFKHRLIVSIQKAGLDPSKWTAHAWMLERKFPEEFGLKQKVEHSSNKEEPITIIYEPVDKKKDNRNILKEQKE